jgi:hypothetical protein
METHPATVVEMNPAKALFIVEFASGEHAAFSLRSHGIVQVGDVLESAPKELGRAQLMPPSRQHFKAFNETGPASLEDCRRKLWGTA